MKNKIENVYYTPDEINQYNKNKSVYIYLFSKNLKKNINNFEIDFNDAYYIEQCTINNWILVTSDNDFDNLNSNITIVKI